MGKEGVIIEFNELYSTQIEEGIEVVSIAKDDKIQTYRIINTEEKLLKYVSNSMEYAEKQLKILVTFECTNICGNFYNAIFLKKFKIDSYCEPKIEESLYLSFTNCYFFEDVELWGGDYRRIKINDSTLEKNLFVRFVNCEKARITNVTYKENLVMENSEIGKLYINTSKFQTDILFQEVTILNDFILDKVVGMQDLIFVDSRFEGLSKLELEVNGELNFYQCSFYKNSEINFDELNGKFSLYKTNFSDKCYLEYELLENKEYEPLIFENDLKKTKWNFLIVSDIYKSSGRIEQYLKTFYYFKRYERLERKHKRKGKYNLLEYLIEIATKYYTSWERTLLSMGLILVAFFLVYSMFPNLLIYKDTLIAPKSLFSITFEMFKTSTFDMKFLISKFGNVLYFTIITFTTVGYGDIMPLNWMKLIVSLESLLGVFFCASFVVTLSRRFF
ncbi:potassium channel family protein [Clostridium sp. C2-6-12]|uniref:potassium channel family protein n=1 Tax=Clostridium sp. C2-6-12 TaxID=2698832 RepID=UPI00136AA808|nr:potassium channel family protein [Clostridium sp. C2-6-12]